MISTSWSMPDSPGKSGCPSINSAITQPVDHTSDIQLGKQKTLVAQAAILTNLCCVVGRAEDELRRPVVPRADVRDVGLILHQNLGATEIAQLEYAGGRIEKQVLRFDVAMADALRVNVGQRTEKLVDVQLNLENGHGRLHLVEESRGSVDSLGDEFLHQVQVDLIFLYSSQHPTAMSLAGASGTAHAFSIRVVEGLQLYDVGVPDDAHDLQFTVL